MALNPPSGIVKWLNTPIGERGWNAFRAQLTGKDYPGTSRKTSYVKLSDEEAEEVIKNIKKDSEGIPLFDEANAPDKREEYQRWLVARYLTKAREEGFESRKKEGVKELEEELGPEGLDELLGLIREEAKVAVAAGGGGGSSESSSSPPPSSSALAVVPKKPEDLVEEDINSVILSILGLEDVFDLTYEEYASLLKEAAVKGRMANSQMSTESIELVTEEFKRVKNKTGRFKVKPKKVNIDKVFNRRTPSPSSAIVKAQKLIPSAAESLQEPEEKPTVDTENLQEDLVNGIGNILESLITIRTLLSSQSKADQKAAQEDRKETEKKKKKQREDTLEKKKPVSPILKAITKPVGDFFDAIKKFFTNVILGSVVLGIFKWLKDPKNQKAIDDFTNFLENNAGLILGGLLAIASVPLVSTILGFLKPITAIAIPALKSAFAFLASPAGLLALATIATKARESQEINRLAEEEAKRRKISKDQVLRERESARNNPLNILGEALSGGGLSISGGGGISLAESMNVDPKAKRKPIRQMSPQEVKLVNKIIESYKNSGSGSKLRIRGIGSVVAGRNFFGMPEIKYFDPSGNQLNKFQWAQRMADAGNPVGAKAAAGVDVKPTPQPKASVQPTTPKVPDSSSTRSGPDPNATFRSPNKSKFSSFFGSKESFRKKAHEGIDDPIQSGTPLSFNQSGKIVDVYRTSSTSREAGGGYGQFVKVQLDDGKVLLMAHLSDISSWVKNGVKFNANEIIAKSGGVPGAPGSGRSGGAHLHFEQHNTPGLGLEETLRGKVDPIAGGGITALQYGGIDKTGKVEMDSSKTTRGQVTSSAQVAPTSPPTPSIPSPTGRGNIVPLPIPTGAGAQQASSGTAPNQAPVPRFSSEDPNNTTTMVVRAIYNIVG